MNKEDEFLELIDECIGKIEAEGGDGRHIVNLINDLNTLAGGTAPIVFYEEPRGNMLRIRSDALILEDWINSQDDLDKLDLLLAELMEDRQALLEQLVDMQDFEGLPDEDDLYL